MPVGKRRNDVALLDLKKDTFGLLDRIAAEQRKSHPTLSSPSHSPPIHSLTIARFPVEPQSKVNLPRFRGSVEIYITEADQDQEGYLARVHVWRLGFGYNLRRILGWKQQLWVL